MNWLNDWQEAANHPRRTLIFLFLSGLVVCGLIGYFRFGHSVGWGIATGLLAAVALSKLGALALATTGRRDLPNPDLSQPRANTRTITAGILRLALLFGTIPVALIVGLATRSGIAFVVTIAVGLIGTLLIRVP